MNHHQKAILWAKRLGHCPGVMAILLSGSLAQGHGNENSDIDFFVITRPGQIWTARFFVFVVLKLSGQLAKPHNHAGKICPNHFITSDRLEIIEKNAYSADLFSHNQPLYDPQNLFPVFAQANNWVQSFGNEFQSDLTPTTPNPISEINFFTKILEKVLKPLQIFIVKNNFEYKTPNHKIILTDTELRFHPAPRNKDWPK